MWLLESDGTLHEGEAPGHEIPGEAVGHAAPARDGAVTIRFGATQDGRGFSTARRLRLAGHVGRLVAAGPLEPDQARHAFQCGFDAVAVDDAQLARHGREAWATALDVSVTEQYVPDPAGSPGAPGIWARRHAA